MPDIIQFGLLGLGIGAIYVLLGDGLIMIYRGSGVVNFAYGAFAMAGAYAFYELNQVLLWSFWPAFIVAVLFVGVISALTHILVMRPLRDASPVVRLIATLGVLTLIEGVATLKYGDTYLNVSSALPTRVINLGAGIVVQEDRLILLAIGAGITVILQIFSRRTMLGLAMTAVSENQRAASSLGWSPDGVALFTWATGGIIAGIGGILIVPITGLSVSGLTLIVVAAMAAALFGGFTSFGMTFVAGTLIGILQSEAVFYLPNVPGLVDGLPFFAIIIILVIRGKGLPVRGHVLERLPRIGSGVIKPKTLVTVFIALMLLILYVFPQGLTIAVTVQLIVGIILLGVVVVTGYAGQLSLAPPYALAGLGAFFAGRLVSMNHWPFVPALIVAVIGSAAVGMIFAVPALRTRGVNLAIATLGLSLTVYAMVFGNPNLTGGTEGMNVGGAKLFGFNIDPIAYPDRYAIFCLCLFIVAGLAVANFRRGRAGRRLIAVRTNERAAASLGIGVAEVKIAAFAVSAALAGLGGVLLGFQSHTVVLTYFDPITSVNSVTWATVGGLGFATGPVAGSGLATGGVGSYILDQFGSLDAWLPIIGGISVILMLLQNPDGVAGAISAGKGDPLTRYIVKSVRNRRKAKASLPAYALTSETQHVAAPHVGRSAVLKVDELTVRYGGVVAVNDLSFSVEPGEIVGLVGPNGAGKTTVVDAVSGYTKPSTGRIQLGDVPLNGLSVQRRSMQGITRSFQSVELFEDLKVWENLQAAADHHDKLAYFSNLVNPGKQTVAPSVVRAAELFGIADLFGYSPNELSYGQRRLVGIVRAVVTQPSILLLDEPAAGFDEHETSVLGEKIKRLAVDWGIGILLIEHDMSLVMSICDRVIVMDFGRKIADGPPSEIQRDPQVIGVYLGHEAEDVVHNVEAAQLASHQEPG